MNKFMSRGAGSAFGGKKLLFVFPIAALLAAGCSQQPTSPQTNNQPAANPPVQQTQTQPAPQGQVYENDYMKVAIPGGWTAKQADQTIYNGSVAEKSSNPAAVNITKGNYTLYINVNAQQASGVEGGRFAEIAMGAPSADAVVTQQPSPPCGTSENHPAILDHPRVDLYVSPQDKTDYCHVPSSGKTVWYFSYISDSKGGYFNYYKNDTPPGFVITMAYNSKDVNSLPVKGSAELTKALGEMTSMVKSMEIKQQ